MKGKKFIYSKKIKTTFKIIIIIFFFLLIKLKSFFEKVNYREKIYKIFESDSGCNNLTNKYLKNFFTKFTRRSIKWPLPKKIRFKPIMTSKELIAFCYFMKPGNIYFEFGAGGSTNIASYYKIKTYSVESDIRWHDKLKSNNIKVNYITIDLKVKSSGYPGKETNINDWKRYIQAYKTEYMANIILIDGRFRVACALDIFTKIKNDTIILIHDYTDRINYHIIENYYIKLKTWGRLAAFIKRNDIKYIPKNIYNKYLYEFL